MYFRYAVGPIEICCALTAFHHMIHAGLTAGKRANIDFLLYFMYSRDLESADDPESEDYITSEALVVQWERMGGQAEAVEARSRPLRKYELYCIKLRMTSSPSQRH